MINILADKLKNVLSQQGPLVSLLSQLTIVIPSYGRPDYLLRNMQYWSGKPSCVLVMDGSPNGLSEKEVSKFGSNITYIHRVVSLTERLSLACDLISTPYATMLSDDDFFSAVGLELAIAELQRDSELACCGGNCASFLWKPESQNVSTRTHYPEQSHFAIDFDDVSKRTIQHFRHYTPAAVYAVHRTPGFRLAMQAANHSNSCIYAAELAFEFVTAYLGKMKTINNCYWLRSLENEPVNVQGSPRSFRFHHWYQDPQYRTEVESWLVHVSRLLEPTPGLARLEVRSLLQAASDNFLHFCTEYFAGKNRADKGTPGPWVNTTAILATRDIDVSDDIEAFLELVANFHQELEKVV